MTLTPASGPWRLIGLRRPGVSIARAQVSDSVVLVQVDVRKRNYPSHCAAPYAQWLMQTAQRGRLLENGDRLPG